MGVLDYRHELETLGHVPRIHEWKISGGGDITAWMEERHQAADHVFWVISAAYLMKPYSSWEHRAAPTAVTTHRPAFALPVFIEPARPRCFFLTSSAASLRHQRRGGTDAFLEPARRRA